MQAHQAKAAKPASPAKPAKQEIKPAEIVEIDYTNHAGERGIRHIHPRHMVFKATEFHPVAQWILDAFDVDKQADRSFAMKDIHKWSPYRK
jgi:predicted DNA-binding transcriptional regulator YafY